MLGTLLFVTASLTAGTAAPSGAVSPPEPDRVAVEAEPQRTRTQPQPSQPQTTQTVSNGPSQRPHTIGFGGTFSISNYGAGGTMRYWFGDRVGLNLNAAWTKPYGGVRTSTGRSVDSGSVFQALPSVIVNLKKANQNADIDLVPYAGAGFQFVTASRGLGYTTSTALQQRTNGVGGQAFGGVEMSFKEAPVTISAEGVYYHLPVRIANAQVIEGFSYLAAVHFYLK